MIKNIVFDLGNVLVSFHPNKFVNENVPAPYKEIFFKTVFGGQEWKDLDRGTLEYDEAVKTFSDKIPQCSKIIKDLFDNNIVSCLSPIKENTDLLPKLKENYNLYIISNFHYPAFDYIYKIWDFFKYFDGKIISGHSKLLKPEIEIYNLLIEKYNLIPTECLFIDDVVENIDGAKKSGMNTLHLPVSKDLKNLLLKNYDIKL